MIAVTYPNKKALKAALGQPLHYVETSMFGPEYKANGTLPFVGPNPTQRKYYGQVTLKDGLIASVK
jgi:hypothetical protein